MYYKHTFMKHTSEFQWKYECKRNNQETQTVSGNCRKVPDMNSTIKEKQNCLKKETAMGMMGTLWPEGWSRRAEFETSKGCRVRPCFKDRVQSCTYYRTRIFLKIFWIRILQTPHHFTAENMVSTPEETVEYYQLYTNWENRGGKST